ncbi:uncharacterized protein LOC101746808 [Bombyx mori]|uniref:Salivary secreted peptide n=1 Tax=Bombyx mori TaxID=7091 RepID=A0A8R2API8_BOMMO|nr:uncharacterized protein LOC101746808 [Bombyx mori]
MKLQIIILVLAAVVIVECGHLFVGTNINRPMVYHHNAKYDAKLFRKRVENLHYVLPQVPSTIGKSIQGILAYDKTHSTASANITQGGIWFTFVNLRMKSERVNKLNYDVYIYV